LRSLIASSFFSGTRTIRGAVGGRRIDTLPARRRSSSIFLFRFFVFRSFAWASARKQAETAPAASESHVAVRQWFAR
jgi:hypothetical protein